MRNLAITAVVSLIVGAAACRYFWPVETKIEVQERVLVRNDIRTVTRTITKLDGTQETVTERIDNSTTNSSRNSTTVINKSTYLVGASIGTKGLKLQPTYGINAAIRVLGPVFAGLYGRTDGEIGLTLAIEF